MIFNFRLLKKVLPGLRSIGFADLGGRLLKRVGQEAFD
jgi:hypothetical protein